VRVCFGFFGDYCVPVGCGLAYLGDGKHIEHLFSLINKLAYYISDCEHNDI